MQEWAASHNARLSFLGRRALATYLAMFVHSSVVSSSELRNLDFLRGRSLESKSEAMRMVQNVGREVGTHWRVGDVMRWDRNEVGRHPPSTPQGEELMMSGVALRRERRRARQRYRE